MDGFAAADFAIAVMPLLAKKISAGPSILGSLLAQFRRGLC